MIPTPFDVEDRLVLCNSRFLSIYDIGPAIATPGVTFESIVRAYVASGLIPESEGREEEWIRKMRDGRSTRSIREPAYCPGRRFATPRPESGR